MSHLEEVICPAGHLEGCGVFMNECRGGLSGAPQEARGKISPVFAVFLEDVGVDITLFSRENIPLSFCGTCDPQKTSLTWKKCQRGWAYGR